MDVAGGLNGVIKVKEAAPEMLVGSCNLFSGVAAAG